MSINDKVTNMFSLALISVMTLSLYKQKVMMGAMFSGNVPLLYNKYFFLADLNCVNGLRENKVNRLVMC